MCSLVFTVLLLPCFGLLNRVLVSVVTPFFRRRYVILPSQRYSVKLFQIGLRVFLFVHALSILLIIEVALHDRLFPNCACARNQ